VRATGSSTSSRTGRFRNSVEVEDVLARHAGLDRHCRTSSELAGFKRPRRFVFVRAIPKTASGKILRRLLRDGQYTEVRP